MVGEANREDDLDAGVLAPKNLALDAKADGGTEPTKEPEESEPKDDESEESGGRVKGADITGTERTRPRLASVAARCSGVLVDLRAVALVLPERGK
jgi:hypothetical protein